jgi:hypothetical protein
LTSERRGRESPLLERAFVLFEARGFGLLALAPLWRLSRFLETELPALLCSWVSLEETEFLELLSEFEIVIEE